jgi:hypothetical protein
MVCRGEAALDPAKRAAVNGDDLSDAPLKPECESRSTKVRTFKRTLLNATRTNSLNCFGWWPGGRAGQGDVLMRSGKLRLVTMLGAVAVLLAATSLAGAQNDGRFCVEAFEDRDGSGTQETGEPLLTRGVSANLIDSTGVIIDTALLDNSPTAAQGLLCFGGLAAGQYTIEIISAEVVATTGNSLTLSITSGETPQVLSFGGRRTTVSTSEDGGIIGELTARYDRDALVQRALISGAGAAAAMFVTAVIGLFIWTIALRGRGRRALPSPDAYYRQRTTTGSMRAVHPTDTGEVRRKQ